MAVDRRTRFRDLIRRLDPTASPSKAIEQGLIVDHADGVAQRIGARLELEPSSTHLLEGGIGSGKTTQLLLVERHLESIDDIEGFYVDVLAHQSPSKLKRGVLMALVGRAILRLAQKVGRLEFWKGDDELSKAVKQVREVANGKWVWTEDDYDPDYEHHGSAWEPGIITSPSSDDVVQQLLEPIERLAADLPFTPVALFDGLDRLIDEKTFYELIAEDVPSLRKAGVGCVVVAPQHIRTWANGAAHRSVDAYHVNGAIDLRSEVGQRFLSDVIRRRAPEGFEDPACEKTAKMSGGILLDLISIARGAAEEAYRHGADLVGEAHVEAAASQFGRNLLLGISEPMVARIKELVPRRSILKSRRIVHEVRFTAATKEDIGLLLRRLVVETPTAPVSHYLHPTIVPLLAGL